VYSRNSQFSEDRLHPRNSQFSEDRLHPRNSQSSEDHLHQDSLVKTIYAEKENKTKTKVYSELNLFNEMELLWSE